MKKTILIILSIIILSYPLQVIFMNVTAFSGAINEFNIQVHIAYDAQRQSAELSLDLAGVDEDVYHIEEVRFLPSEEILTQVPYAVNVSENATYTYEIVYYDKKDMDVETETTTPKTIQLEAIVNQLTQENDDQNANTKDAEGDIDSKTTHSLNDIQTFDLENNIDMSKAFDLSGFSTQITSGGLVHEWDKDSFITVDGSTVTAGDKSHANSTKRYYQTMHLKSKFKVDFSRSFEIVGTGRTPSENPDGVTFGFYNDDSFSFLNGYNNTGGGMGIYSVSAATLQQSVHNAIVYEIDTYNNRGISGYEHLKDDPFVGRHAALMTVDENGILSAHSGNTIQDTYLKQEQPYKIKYDKDKDILDVSWTENALYHYTLSNPKEYLKSDYANFYMSGVINQMEEYGSGGSLSVSFLEFKYTDVEYQADIMISTKKGNDDVLYKEEDISTYPKPGEEVTVKYEIYNKLFEISNKQTPIRFSKVAIGDTPLVPYDIKAYGEDGKEFILEESDIFNGSELENDIYKTTLIDIPMHSEKIYIEYKLKLDERYQGNSSITNEIYLGVEGMEQFVFSSHNKAMGLPTLRSTRNQHIATSKESNIITNEQLLQDIVGHVYDVQESSAVDSFEHGNLVCTLEDMHGSSLTQINQSQYGVYKQNCILTDKRYELTSPNLIRHIYVSDIYQESENLQISAHRLSVAMTELKQHRNDLEAWIKQKTDVVASVNGQRLDQEKIKVNLQEFNADSSYDNSPYIIKFQADDTEHGTSAIIEVPIEVVSGIDLTVENIIINQAELQAHEHDLSTYLLQLANVSAKIGDEPLTDYLTFLNLKEFNAFVESSETPYELEVIVTTQSTQITEKAALFVSVTPNVYSYLSIPSRIELFEDQGYVNGSYDEQYAGAKGSIQYQGNAYAKQVKITIPSSVTLYPEDRIGKDIFIAQLYDLSGNSLIEQGGSEVEIVNTSGADKFDVQFRLNTKKAQDKRQTHYTGILGFHIEISTR